MSNNISIKKISIILALFLTGLYIIFSLAFHDDQYKAEKMLYGASRKQVKIMTRPDAVSPNLIEEAEAELKEVIDRFPETDAAKSAHMRLAELYIADKRYEKALQLADEIGDRYAGDPGTASKGYFFKVIVYERQDRWDKALSELERLRDEYPTTIVGLQSPMYIAEYYLRAGDKDKAIEGYRSAAAYYEGARKKHKGLLAGYASSNMAIKAFIFLGDFEKAGEIVEESITDYPSAMVYSEQLQLVDAIFAEKLKQPKKAIELYKIMIRSTNDQKLKEYLHARIGKFLEEE
ncbi:MAG: tetratricopeptide repeat protein [Candidatus Omnitrophota bacterium]